MGSKPACTREGSGYLLLGHPYSRPRLRRRLQWGWWRRLRCCKLVLRHRSPRCSLRRRSCYLPDGRNLDHRILVFWTRDACELLQIGRQTSWRHELDDGGSLWKHDHPLFVAGFSAEIERIERIERHEVWGVRLKIFERCLEQYIPHDFSSSYGCSEALWKARIVYRCWCFGQRTV